MNNFTEDNTKDATHALIYKRSDGCIVEFHNDNNCTYFSVAHHRWQGSQLGINRTLASIAQVELSRPHNETREYWTTNGVTKYAMDSNMKTDKIIPIDFSLNITPAVPGDVVYNSQSNNTFTLNTVDIGHIECDSKNGHLFVVSFADRPNTGKQPVGGDVVVNITLKGGSDAYSRVRGGDFNWDQSDSFPVATWKPSHVAMLKQWQAEQSKAETWNVKESYVPHGGVPSDLQLPDPSVDENSDGSKIGNIGNILHNMSCSMTDENEQSEFGGYASFCWGLGVKLKQDTIKSALANWDGKQSFDFGMAYLDGGGTKCEFLGQHAGIVIGRPLTNGGIPTHNKYYLSTSDKTCCKPIQTDEDKLRDAMTCALTNKESASVTDMSLVSIDIDALLSSDKFTITLSSE